MAEDGPEEPEACAGASDDAHEGAQIVQLRLAGGAIPPRPPKPPAPAVPGDPWDEVPKRIPVIPPWLRDPQRRRAAFLWAVTHHAHKTAFHVARTPKYLSRTVASAPVGAGRVLGHAWAWTWDREGHPLRVQAVAANDAARYVTLAKLRRERVRHRLIADAVFLGAGTIGVTLAVADWPPARWVLITVAVLMLGVAGRPRGKPVLDPAVLAPQAEKLTPDRILTALGTLGIPGINKAITRGSEIPMIIGRDGPGWRADVDLPPGVTPAAIMDKRQEFASGLRRATGCVWPSASEDSHAGRLVLYVCDDPMSQARQPPWPLAARGQASVFRPVPFGTDQRGQVVTITLIFEAMLIGGIPRSGKTGAMRVLTLAGMLHLICELHVFDLKGTGDLKFAEPVAHRYASGGADEVTLAGCMDSLREVDGYLASRARTISGLPSVLVPDRKVTPEVAGRRELRLHPVLVIIDEIQELMTSEHAKEAEAILLRLMKRGPAMGIGLIMATQRPDNDSLPKSISANAGVRFCLRIVDDRSNNMILGAGMYSAGFRATMFTKSDKGVGWLAGHADQPQVARTFYMDAPAAEKIARRAKALREAAGTLTGDAAGSPPPEVSLLRDVLDVMPEHSLWLETIAGRLAGRRPNLYGGWDAKQLGSALRKQGVEPAQQWREGSNRNGVSRADLLNAMGDGRG